MKIWICKECMVGPCELKIDPRGWNTGDSAEWKCPIDGTDDANWQEAQ